MKRFLFIAALVLLAGVYIFTNSYYILMLLALMGVMLLVSLLLFLSAKAELKLDAHAEMNKADAYFDYVVQSTGIMPVSRLEWTAACENTFVGASANMRMGCSLLGRNKQQNIHVGLPDVFVGRMELAAEDVCIYDFFGVFSRKLPAPAPASALVYPSFSGMDIDIQNMPESAGDGIRYFPGRRGYDVNELRQLREYADGDEMKSIYWKLSAKLDRLVIREFALPVRYAVMVVIELMRPEKDAEAALDACMETATAISLHLLEQGINHNIAWHSPDGFMVRELSSVEDLQLALPAILSVLAYDDMPHSIQDYLESPYVGRHLAPIYVTPVLDTERMAQVSVLQQLKTYYVFPGDVQLDDESQYFDISVITATDEDEVADAAV